MKKLLMSFLVIAVLLVGCEAPVRETRQDGLQASRFTVIARHDTVGVSTLVDKETGCNYLVFDRGLAPLYDADGKVVGCGKQTTK